MNLPIAVIVPAYNAAAFLRESLASVAAQTCGVAEVIVVDDGSTDDTADIARAFGATVVSQSNRGLAEARNAGIRASRAPYVALLDADDRWHPQRLEAQWRVCEARPEVAIVASDYALWTLGELSGPVLPTHKQFANVARERIGDDAYLVSSETMLAALAVRNFVLPSSMLVDRRIFDREGIYYRARERLPNTDDAFVGEDYEWVLRALRVTPIAFVDRVLVDYRQAVSGLSARRGRIRYGDVLLGEMIASDPQAYVAGAAAAFARTRPQALRDASLAHFKSAEFSYAADRLREYGQTLPYSARACVSLAARALRPAWMRPFLLPLTRLRRPGFLR